MTYLVVEGGDKSGKGFFIKCLQEQFGERVFDVDEYWLSEGHDPPVSCLDGVGVILISEMSYVCEGAALRDYLVREPPEGYSSPPAQYIAELYARDRARLLTNIVAPALKRGIHVISSRNVFSSLLFQPVDAQFRGETLTRDQVKIIPGNALALSQFLPTHVINCTVSGETRRTRRDEDENPDNAIFETNSFSKAVAKIYDNELPQICVEYDVVYESISLEGTHEETRTKAKEYYQRIFA